jgi:hypothetical protein
MNRPLIKVEFRESLLLDILDKPNVMGFESVDFLYNDFHDFNLWDKLPFVSCDYDLENSRASMRFSIDLLEDFGDPNDVRFDRFYKTLLVGFDGRTGRIVLHEGMFYSVNDVFTDKEVTKILLALQICLISIHSGCQAKLCKITDKQKRINERRIKDGKKPIYEEQTIKIKPSIYYKPTGQHRNYTPPCAHQRRGHFRTYPSGKRGWVKDCKVSQGSERTIKSDYVFEYDVV